MHKCDRYCCYCQGLQNIRLCMDGKYYCGLPEGEISVAQSDTQRHGYEDPVRVVFHLDQSWNLVSVFCCAVEHQAIHADLRPSRRAMAQRRGRCFAAKACSQLSGNGSRVDVTLKHIRSHRNCDSLPRPGDAADRVGDVCFFRCAFGSERARSDELLSRVDRVLYNAEVAQRRTTLIRSTCPRITETLSDLRNNGLSRTGQLYALLQKIIHFVIPNEVRESLSWA